MKEEPDLVDRLRTPIVYRTIRDTVDMPSHPYGCFDDLLAEAADEIERLRTKLARVPPA